MTVEEYLKGAILYEKEGQIIFVHKENDELIQLCDIRGWGHIQHLFVKEGKSKNIDFASAMSFQDQVGEFIKEAIEEKLKKHYEKDNKEDSKKG